MLTTNSLSSPLQTKGAPPGATKVEEKVNSIEGEGGAPPVFDKVLEGKSDKIQNFKPSEERRVETGRPIEESREVQSPNEKSAINSQDEAQRLMLKFMDSMENELGIAPVEIVAAMSQLGPVDLTLPPEQTVEQVIGKLNLEDDEQEIAADIYSDLLAGLSSLKTAPQPTADAWMNPAMMGGMMAGGALASQQFNDPLKGQSLPQNAFQQAAPKPELSRRDALNQSIDRMNDRFFLKEQPPVVAPGTQVVEDSFVSQSKGEMPQAVTPSGGRMEIPEDMQMVQPKTYDPKGYDPKLVATTAGLAAHALKAMPKAESSSLEKMQANGTETLPTNTTALQMNMDTLPSLEGSASSSSGDSMSFNESASESDLASLGKDAKTEGDAFALPQGEKQVGPQGKSFVGAAVAGGAMTRGQDSQDPNIQAIMSRAKVMIQDGGGEMRVQMSPDGMGTIDLQVAVENGKVNVKMVADTPEAKKLIESASQDLKQHLNANKLDVGSIKVDLASESSTNNSNNNAQKQFEQALDQRGRDQAQQFFNQMRDGNMGQRHSQLEMQDLRGYSTRRGPKLEPQTLSNCSHCSRPCSIGAT